MAFDQGEIVLYETEDGRASLNVQLREETVWLTQSQMVELFQKTKQNISLHVRNIFKEMELQEDSVVKEYLTTAADGKQYKTKYYNLDVIISVGYRVKSRRGTQFRIWSTSVLRDHLVKGYTLNQKRLAEKGLHEARQMLALLSNTLVSQKLVNDEGQAVLHLVQQYAGTWRLLWQFDEDSLALPQTRRAGGVTIQIEEAVKAIATLRRDLIARGEATDIFGNERDDGLAGIFGAIRQTFDGRELYPSIEEKAAHLLYFVIKDHPFTDGNKRIGSFLFLYFLQINGLLDDQRFDNKALVALTLLTAASDPSQKDLLIRLIINVLADNEVK